MQTTYCKHPDLLSTMIQPTVEKRVKMSFSQKELLPELKVGTSTCLKQEGASKEILLGI